MSLNRVVIMGRLGRDPELKHTASGVAVCSFSLAVDRNFKDKDGSAQTDWIDVVAWRQTAEFAAKYFSRGRAAVVDGSLQVREWTDKDGNKRRAAEVVADSIYFADSKQDARSGSYAPAAPSAPSANRGFAQLSDDDDVPF